VAVSNSRQRNIAQQVQMQLVAGFICLKRMPTRTDIHDQRRHIVIMRSWWSMWLSYPDPRLPLPGTCCNSDQRQQAACCNWNSSSSSLSSDQLLVGL